MSVKVVTLDTTPIIDMASMAPGVLGHYAHKYFTDGVGASAVLNDGIRRTNCCGSLISNMVDDICINCCKDHTLVKAATRYKLFRDVSQDMATRYIENNDDDVNKVLESLRVARTMYDELVCLKQVSKTHG